MTYKSHFGGVAEHVRNISERLVARRHDVNVFATDPLGVLRREETLSGVKVKRFRSWAPGGAYYFSPALKKHLEETSDTFDVVHAHDYHALPALYASQTKKSNRLVFTSHYHGRGHTWFRNMLHIPYRMFGRTIFQNSDRIVCVSHHEKNLVERDFCVDDRKIVVIPNGIDLNEFRCLGKTEGDRKTILYVGRLEEYKGVQYLIGAVPKLDEDVAVEIVGTGSYKAQLLRLVDKLGLQTKVAFYEDLPRVELLQRYAKASLFVLLSRHEAYSIVVAEALASKTPCIVANQSALKEWIDDENCFGIDYPIDYEELAKMVERVMKRRVGTVTLPTWDCVVESLCKLYADVSGGVPFRLGSRGSWHVTSEKS